MGLLSQALGPVRGVLRQILSDPNLKSTVTYRKYTGTSWDEVNRNRVSTFDESQLDVARLRHNDKTLVIAASGIQAGDQLYLISYSDAPAGMSLKDEIVDEFGQTQSIADIANIFQLCVVITVEGGTNAIGG